MPMHVREVLCELLQVVTDELFLLVILIEHTLLGDVFHILLCDSQRAVTVVDMEQHFTSELEFRRVVYHFLYAKSDAELSLI